MRRLIRNQRGQILIFVALSIVFLVVVAGFFGSDVTRLMSDKGELQATLDAAALAGAGKLGFNDTVFPTARDFANTVAQENTNRSGTVTISPNVANDPTAFDSASVPYGDMLLGIWDPSKPRGIGVGQRFEPSLDGTKVNAVACRYKRQVRASFLSLWGLVQMNVGAMAIATANPPQTTPTDACLFPIGVGSCPFQGPTSLGCGAAITFITSSNQDTGAGCLAPPCSNTAAWVSLVPGQDPNVPNLESWITAAGGGSCTGTTLNTFDSVPTNNGMAQPVMDTVQSVFTQEFNASGTLTVTDNNNNATYTGPGWKVYIPVIQSDCPAGALSGTHEIVGWTEMVITQVIDKGKCAVANHWHDSNGTNPWDPIGAPTNCVGTQAPKNAGALRAIFGYYSCNLFKVNPIPIPGPRSALATKLRLVQ